MKLLAQAGGYRILKFFAVTKHKQLGLTSSQYDLLKLWFLDVDGHTPSFDEYASKLGVSDGSYVSKCFSALVKRGYLAPKGRGFKGSSLTFRKVYVVGPELISAVEAWEATVSLNSQRILSKKLSSPKKSLFIAGGSKESNKAFIEASKKPKDVTKAPVAVQVSVPVVTKMKVHIGDKAPDELHYMTQDERWNLSESSSECAAWGVSVIEDDFDFGDGKGFVKARFLI